MSKSKVRGLLKDSFFYSLTKIIPGGAGLLSVILFINWVGPVEYGKYSLLLAFLMVISTFAFGWLNQAILRYYSLHSRYREFYSTLLKGGVVGLGIIVSMIILFSKVAWPFDYNWLIAALTALAIALFTQVNVLFQAKRRPQRVFYLTTLWAVLALIIPLILLSITGKNYQTILLGLALAYLISTISLTGKRIYSKRKLAASNASSEKPLLKQYLKFGGPLSFWYIGSLSLMLLDRFFIQHYYGTELMGSYAGFSELTVRLFSILLFPITLSAHPRIMAAWNKGNKRSSLLIWKQAIRLQSSIFFALLVGTILLSGVVQRCFQIFLPHIDIPFVPLFFPVLTGGFFWQLALLAHKPLELNNKTGIMLLLIIIAVAINILGNMIFLPRYGLPATAYTMVASGIVYCTLTLLSARQVLKANFSSGIN